MEKLKKCAKEKRHIAKKYNVNKYVYFVFHKKLVMDLMFPTKMCIKSALYLH